jgi:uncharacterized YigZ family protein
MDNASASDGSDAFLTLAGPGTAEVRVSGSRFLGLALPITGEQEVAEQLTQRTREYHDATHHCFAAILGADRREQSSDAGEPRGTAGIPILGVIQGAQLTDTLVIVTRYFGGTKLGKGNLARAYRACAEEAVRAAPKRIVRHWRRFRIEVPFNETGKLYTLARRNGWEIVPVDSVTERGSFEVRVPLSQGETVRGLILDATGGRASIMEEGLWRSS